MRLAMFAAMGAMFMTGLAIPTAFNDNAVVFAVAEMAGWLVPPARAEHVAFGAILGPDRKVLRTIESPLEMVEAEQQRAVEERQSRHCRRPFPKRASLWERPSSGPGRRSRRSHPLAALAAPQGQAPPSRTIGGATPAPDQASAWACAPRALATRLSLTRS